MNEIIFESDLFQLQKVRGKSIHDINYLSLEVVSKGVALDCCVEIKLDISLQCMEAIRKAKHHDTLHYKYTGSWVSWGIPSRKYTKVDTFIHVLQQASDFSDKVNAYIESSEWKDDGNYIY